MIKKNIANIVTCTRIIGTIIMALSTPLSQVFFIAFIYSGISDVLDGFLARKLNIQSDLGRKLDSISDIMFFTTLVLKLWAYLRAGLPKYVWVLIWTVAAIRIASYAYTFIKKKMLMSNHTILNKITGFVLFFLPFMVLTKYLYIFSLTVTIISLISALYEVIIIIKDKQVTKIEK